MSLTVCVAWQSVCSGLRAASSGGVGVGGSACFGVMQEVSDGITTSATTQMHKNRPGSISPSHYC